MIKEKLFRKQDNGSNYIIDTLPKFPKEGALLFTSEDNKTMKSIKIGEEEIPVTYDSDAWIGNNRKYSTEWYMIVAKIVFIKK